MQRLLLRCVLYLTIIVLITSCATKRPILQIAADASGSAEQDGLAATLTYRNDESLAQEFGKESNPFLTEYSRLVFRRRMVFGLTLENRGSGEHRFRLSECELQYGDRKVRPTNQFQLINEWQMMDDSAKLAKQKEPIIKKYVLPTEKLVPPGGSLRGLLLFQGNLPAHGQARVFIAGIPGGPPLQIDFEF